MTDAVVTPEVETPAIEPHADPSKFEASLAELAKAEGVALEAVKQNLPKRVVEELPPEVVAEAAKADEKTEAKTEEKPAEVTPPQKETPEQVRARLDAKAQEYSLARAAQEEARTAKEEAKRAIAQRDEERTRAREMEIYRDAATDPKKWVEIADKNGMHPKQIADWVVQRDQPLTPEQLLEKAKAEGRAEAQRFFQEEQAKAQAAQSQQRQMQEISGFIGFVGQTKVADKSAFPALKSLYTPEQLAYEFHRARELPSETSPGGHFGRLEARGLTYTYDDVAKYLEEQNQARYREISDAFSNNASVAQTSNSATSTAAPVTSAASTTARAPAVGSAAASPTSLPGNYASLSKEEQARLDLALYEKIRQR